MEAFKRVEAWLAVPNLCQDWVSARLGETAENRKNRKDDLKKAFSENYKPVTMRLTGHVIS